MATIQQLIDRNNLAKVWANAAWTEPADMDSTELAPRHLVDDYAKRLCDSNEAVQYILNGECSCPHNLCYKTGGPWSKERSPKFCILHGDKDVWMELAKNTGLLR